MVLITKITIDRNDVSGGKLFYPLLNMIIDFNVSKRCFSKKNHISMYYVSIFMSREIFYIK